MPLPSLRRVAPLALVVLLAACGKSAPLQPVDGPAPIVFGAGPGTTRTDPLTIREARIQGDLLRVAVSFGGGCREHLFSLISDAAFLESSPVQLRLRLAHDAQGDMCRALVGRELSFDLAPVREAYRKQYGEHGTVVLRLHEPGAAQPVQAELVYRF